jgi:hypothetical protein
VSVRPHESRAFSGSITPESPALNETMRIGGALTPCDVIDSFQVSIGSESLTSQIVTVTYTAIAN